MAFWDDWFGPEKTEQTSESKRDYVQLPDYAETSKAREQMSEKLDLWGGQEGYGGIAPNWDEIWGDSEKKLKQYYWGSATDPGVIGKMGADAAKKGQTDQPAYLRSLAKMGATESGDISSMAIKQAMEKATFAEKGRQNWMEEMNFMMGLKPNYQVGSTSGKQTSQTSGGEGWGMLESLGGAAVSAMMPGFGDLESMFGGEKKGVAKIAGQDSQFTDFGGDLIGRSSPWD